MIIARGALSELKRHCRSSDEEVCGFCLGKAGTVTGIRRARNAAPAHMRAALFILSPEDTLWLARQRIAGSDVLAVYHSHPAIPATPSVVDVAGLRFGDIAYLIYGGERGDVRAWRRKDGTLVEEDMEVR